MERARRLRHILGLLPDDASWFNLGDWSAAQTYSEAAERLALRVGDAARLRAGSRVLDLACGDGASLLLWRARWQVGPLTALEPHADSRRRIMGLNLPECELLPERSVSDLWATRSQARYDAIVCVDAAYHFPQAALFLEDCAQRLERGGYLSFTTLCPSDEAKPSLWIRIILSLFFKAARMSRSSLLPIAAWRRLASGAEWSSFESDILDEEVLGGFQAFGERRRRDLPFALMWNRDWLKIWITAKACGFILRRGLAHYALLRLRRGDG